MGGSARGPDGAPAFNATLTATWDVRFEQDGEPVDIPGAPPEVTVVKKAAVQVGEVQTVVTWAR